MSETPANPENPTEIGKVEFGEFINVFADRTSVGKQFNGVGFAGDIGALQRKVEAESVYPAAGFAIVAEGMGRYRRTELQLLEDTDSMRSLADALNKGVSVYETANGIAKVTIEGQIKEWMASHGGEYDENTDWSNVIEDMAVKLKKKADAFDEVNK